MQDYTPHTKDDLDVPIWHAENMAPVIGCSECKTRRLIKMKLIDVTKVGAQYVSTKRRLRRSVGIDHQAGEVR